MNILCKEDVRKFLLQQGEKRSILKKKINLRR